MIFAIPTQQQTLIDNIPTMTSIAVTLASQISQGALLELLILPLYENTQMPIYGTFTPNYLPCTYIDITHPFIDLTTASQYLLYRLNNTLSPYLIT